MFRHILIPTDGSPLAERAISAGVNLAKEMGARVTGFCAEESRPLHLNASFGLDRAVSNELERRSHLYATHAVAAVERAAKAAGVPFEALVVKARRPSQAILEAAQARECDAIVMASHGHAGLKALLLGSVTQEVLTHSQLPVLVFR